MTQKLALKTALGLICGLASVMSGRTAEAVEPEKQPIYTNTIGGVLCGTNIANQCKVPANRRLIIEYASGINFAPASSDQTTETTMAVTDPGLGLNGNGFHIFPATKVNRTGEPMCSPFQCH